METTRVNGEITGHVQMYGRPEPLNIEAHGDLGLDRTPNPFTFAAKTSAVPLLVTEFAPASLSYPIIFGGPQLAPLAVMSIRQNENLFLNEAGAFEPDTYVPAFIRRYPFVLANNEADQQMVVCIDREAPSLVKGGEVPLFENGKPSAFTEQAIQFCTNFETERRRTDEFVATLKGLDLFHATNVSFTPRQQDGSEGAPVQLADFFAVSEEKLAKLPAEEVAKLHVSGALRQIHAHLTSILNWERLLNRTTARFPDPASESQTEVGRLI